MSYQDDAARLRKALRLEYRPVVIGLAENPPAGLPRYTGAPLKACQMIDKVRFANAAFHTLEDDHRACPEALRYFGFADACPGLLSGERGAGDSPEHGHALTRTPGAFRNMLREAPLIAPRSVKCVYFVSLERADEAPLRGDEVVLFVANPRQTLYLSRASIYSCGGLGHGVAGPPACLSVVMGPFLHRSPYDSLGCFDTRVFMNLKGHDMFFGLPVEQLPRLIEDVELLLRRRPDLDKQLDEPVESFHEVTDYELAVQKSKGKLL